METSFLQLSSLDLMESGLVRSSNNESGPSSSAQKVRSKASRRAEQLPPVDCVRQLRKWRAKASLYAQLAVKAELLPKNQRLPQFFKNQDYLGLALAYYEKSFLLARVFDIGGGEFEGRPKGKKKF